jgi:hypothetical protein
VAKYVRHDTIINGVKQLMHKAQVLPPEQVLPLLFVSRHRLAL